MHIRLEIWRQDSPTSRGRFVPYELDDLSPEMSLLEVLDHLNEILVRRKERTISYEYDCREGICGQCGLFINGRAHGPHDNITTCQLHMRSFSDGDTLVLEPWRARAFPIIRDLVVDRSSFDRIIEQGGYITAKTGTAPEANSILIGKEVADESMDSAACIGCGACVASCKNASATLFVAAKINHLNSLPQGHHESDRRVLEMTRQMEREGFGSCSLTGACEVECPEGISITNIVKLNRRWLKSRWL